MQVLLLQNRSAVAVAFTINAEAKGVFAFDARFGTLKPNLPASVCITFAPKSEANSWKRLSIGLAGTDPIDVDLIGTGFSETARPPPLSIAHVDAFLQRVVTGGPVLPPAQTEDGSMSSVPLGLRSGAPPLPGLLGYHSWDLMFDGQDVAHALTVEPALLHFAATCTANAAESQTLTVTNHLPFKVACSLSMPSWLDPAQEHKPSSVWRADTPQQDIGAGQSVTFQVSFVPPADGRYYVQEVDVVAHAKYMRNFRLCSEVWLRPFLPQMLAVPCIEWMLVRLCVRSSRCVYITFVCHRRPQNPKTPLRLQLNIFL